MSCCDFHTERSSEAEVAHRRRLLRLMLERLCWDGRLKDAFLTPAAADTEDPHVKIVTSAMRDWSEMSRRVRLADGAVSE